MKWFFPALTFLFSFMPVHAATVFKCTGPDGRVTFTQQNCPENNDFKGSVEVRNHAPSGSSSPVKMASPKERSSIKSPQKREVTVVGTPKPLEDRFPESRAARETSVRRQDAGGKQRVDVRDVRVNTTKRNRDGSVSGRSTSYRVPVLK
ncbi:TPA: DUF4124 domain-containing protein [Pseudomonas aeruginosa]|nr:DUF4124 domain-containing protein [Pseudomonas aeruginosa]